MPRFFFDVTNHKGVHSDEFGENFTDGEDAREQCRLMLPDFAREELPSGEFHTITCDVRDETGRVVYRGKIIYEGTIDPV